MEYPPGLCRACSILAGFSFSHDIRYLIEEARRSVALIVNAGIATLYWQIGNRVTDEILKGNERNMRKRLSSDMSV
jgi:hypothetical protein